MSLPRRELCDAPLFPNSLTGFIKTIDERHSARNTPGKRKKLIQCRHKWLHTLFGKRLAVNSSHFPPVGQRKSPLLTQRLMHLFMITNRPDLYQPTVTFQMYGPQLFNTPRGISVSLGLSRSWLHEVWEIYESESNNTQRLPCILARYWLGCGYQTLFAVQHLHFLA